MTSITSRNQSKGENRIFPDRNFSLISVYSRSFQSPKLIDSVELCLDTFIQVYIISHCEKTIADGVTPVLQAAAALKAKLEKYSDGMNSTLCKLALSLDPQHENQNVLFNYE